VGENQKFSVKVPNNGVTISPHASYLLTVDSVPVPVQRPGMLTRSQLGAECVVDTEARDLTEGVHGALGEGGAAVTHG
jgi:hypothetical protein